MRMAVIAQRSTPTNERLSLQRSNGLPWLRLTPHEAVERRRLRRRPLDARDEARLLHLENREGALERARGGEVRDLKRLLRQVRVVFPRQGIAVVRFANDQVFLETEAVLEQIVRVLGDGPSPRPSPR